MRLWETKCRAGGVARFNKLGVIEGCEMSIAENLIIEVEVFLFESRNKWQVWNILQADCAS